MSGRIGVGRRPFIFWAICSECLTYIWVEEASIVNEDTIVCQYCGSPISLLGGADLAKSCNQLQALLEDIERQVATLPTAIDVHRFISEQVGNIASSFNDRLDEIHQSRVDETADLEAHQTS